MTRRNDPLVSTSSVPTISIPIQIPDAITPVMTKDLPSKDVQFIAENLSVKAIEKVISRYYKRLGYFIEVYYSPKKRARFLVNVMMHFGLITVSDFVSMFAENEPEAVILPVDELLVEGATEVNLEGCERLKRIVQHGTEEGMGKVIYLKGSEQLRHAS
ncbi:MAG: hypothetical protein JWN26_630 [Candidatus Saccharibacteria bacterium]|nr:hypothetical protein [Candidatus Saccharibacteria bacterium]